MSDAELALERENERLRRLALSAALDVIELQQQRIAALEGRQP